MPPNWETGPPKPWSARRNVVRFAQALVHLDVGGRRNDRFFDPDCRLHATVDLGRHRLLPEPTARAGSGPACSAEQSLPAEASWQPFRTFDVPPGQVVKYEFPAGYSARWVRARWDTPCRATVWLSYE
jgi:hypothetical protein